MGHFRGYLSVRPVGLASALSLYRCYAGAAVMRVAQPCKFVTVGQYLARPIVVESQGLRYRLRPRSEDLAYILPTHKPMVQAWFRPEPRQTVVDIGASIGQFSLKAAKAGSKVVAVEANPTTAEALRFNCQMNDLLGVEIRQVAVGASHGTATLHSGAFSGVSSLRADWDPKNQNFSPTRYRVETVTLDELCQPLAKPIDWLLIDVEGSELGVLRGGRETLRRTKTVIIEASAGETQPACQELLASAGLATAEKVAQGQSTDYWLMVRSA